MFGVAVNVHDDCGLSINVNCHYSCIRLYATIVVNPQRIVALNDLKHLLINCQTRANDTIFFKSSPRRVIFRFSPEDFSGVFFPGRFQKAATPYSELSSRKSHTKTFHEKLP